MAYPAWGQFGQPVSAADRILGNGGNSTVYQRPNGSQYALDRYGRLAELPCGTTIIGPAQFDSRNLYSS